MGKENILSAAAVAGVVLLSVLVGGFLFGANNSPQSLGTDITKNTATDSYTDGADFRQNVQAIAERMEGLTEGQILQADSNGNMQATSLTSVDVTGVKLPYEAITSSNTSTAAEAGKTYFLSGATSTQALPTSTIAGLEYTFMVSGALTGDATVVTDGGANVIEGSLIVAGAVVDCASEDTLTFVSDGENVGDFVTLVSDGTSWLIKQSGALASAKLTCSAT